MSDEKIAALLSEMEKLEIPLDRRGKFIEFEMRCGGVIGGYGLNLWVWGLVPGLSAWHTEIVIEFDEEFSLWMARCYFDGHPSDDWSMDENGAVYWCGNKKSEDSSQIVEEYKIDIDEQILLFENRNSNVGFKGKMFKGLNEFYCRHKVALSEGSIAILRKYDI